MRISDWSSDVCSSDLIIHTENAGVISRFERPVRRVGRRRQTERRHPAVEFGGAVIGQVLILVRGAGAPFGRAETAAGQRIGFVAVADRKSTRLNSSH